MSSLPTRALTVAEEPAAAEVLARAFERDPGMVFVFPDDRTRVSDSIWFFSVMLRYARSHATVLTTPQVGAVAICLPPAHVFSPESMAAAGMADAPTRLGAEELVLLGRLNTALGALHHDVMREPHWQLSFLGTDPDRQGQGHGGALVDALSALAAADGVPIYLDTLDAGNVTFYRNHGYTTLRELDLPDSDVHVWAMQNQPGALPVRPAG